MEGKYPVFKQEIRYMICLVSSYTTIHLQFSQLEPEDAMETVDEGRVERMASGGMSHQDQEQNDEKSTEQGELIDLQDFALRSRI